MLARSLLFVALSASLFLSACQTRSISRRVTHDARHGDGPEFP